MRCRPPVEHAEQIALSHADVFRGHAPDAAAEWRWRRMAMDTVNRRCAGLDVHKDSVWACARADGRQFVEKFGTTSRELLRLGDWLAGHGVTIVAMESTGVFWKPVWNLLEDRFKVMLVNARHVKQVPGRKTDVSDCQWIAELLEHGLLEASFVPQRPQRELRDLTRQRTQLLGDRARVVDRIQKVLEDANVKLASVATDVMGKSGRAILDALVEGKLTAEQMAELVHRRMEAKKPLLREALAGKVTDHHRFMLKQLLGQVDHLDRLIAEFDARVEAVMSPLEREAVKRLDEVPGFDVRTGQNVIAEIGTDMARFPTPQHLASWAGMCPGNDESAGKRKGGRTRKANHWLKGALTQAAWGAGRTRRSYYSAQHRRLTARRGVKRATIAVAHSLLVTVHCLLSEPDRAYLDLGATYFEKLQSPEQQAEKLVRKLQRLGYVVEVKKPAA
jgi:transposase